MSYQATVRHLAQTVAADSFEAADTLTIPAALEAFRGQLTPGAVARYHAEHVGQCAEMLRRALAMQAQSDRERLVTPDEAVSNVRDAAAALLTAIGEKAAA
jgi:hypothetical protein